MRKFAREPKRLKYLTKAALFGSVQPILSKMFEKADE